MTVVVNGEAVDIEGPATVAGVLRRMNVPVDAAGVAVARNGEVVPRSSWNAVAVVPGDRIEVLHAVQGG
ncbi:MAG: sulfur carrier protein ThiS [Candidatus Dormibacteraeota bacterium]|nr:sulfur carrier protein ThiS [Candidatus Dormibacteraeota bacterium]